MFEEIIDGRDDKEEEADGHIPQEDLVLGHGIEK